jgi:hypothetical protein
VRGDTHAGFGERSEETDRQQCRHRASGRLNHRIAQRVRLFQWTPGPGYQVDAVWGGVSFWRSLTRLDLIDEFHLDVFRYMAARPPGSSTTTPSPTSSTWSPALRGPTRPSGCTTGGRRNQRPSAGTLNKRRSDCLGLSWDDVILPILGVLRRRPAAFKAGPPESQSGPISGVVGCLDSPSQSSRARQPAARGSCTSGPSR